MAGLSSCHFVGWHPSIGLHMGRNMCETTAPSRVKNDSRVGVRPDFPYATCYMLCCRDQFFLSPPPPQREINCKEGGEFVFILARWAPGARMEEDSCGGRLADPLPSASPVPRCTESVTKQASRNTGQTLRASHWDEHYFLSAPQPKKLHTSNIASSLEKKERKKERKIPTHSN